MAKKLSLLIATLAALALAAPALASANALTMPANFLVILGTGLTSKSVNMTVQTALGTIQCENVTFATEVTENNGKAFSALGLGAGTATGCVLGGKEVVLEDITDAGFRSIAALAGETELTFKAKLPGGFSCHFYGAAVGFGYVAGNDSFRIVNKALAATPAGICAPGILNADFTVETTVGGGGVILD